MIIEGKNYSWSQPLCESCWKITETNSLRFRQFLPNRISEKFRKEEKCALCGHQHKSGIYLRIDPREVPYPALKD